MEVIYRKYGEITEITRYEVSRSAQQMGLRRTGKRSGVYGPRRMDNVRRAKQGFMRCVFAGIKEFGSPLFVTLTFRGDASDVQVASKALSTFQLRLRRKFSGTASIFVPELSKRGRIHFHGFVFGLPLSWGDTREGKRTVRTGSERRHRKLAALWGSGWLDCCKTDGSARVVSYAAKYVTKNVGDSFFAGTRLVRVSHGFPRGVELRGKFAAFLADRYAQLQPIKQFATISEYVGLLTKQWYADEL